MLYLPFAVITGAPLADRLGTWLFAAGAYVVGCFLVKFLMNRWWPRSPRWLLYFLCACLAFCNTFPYMLREARRLRNGDCGGPVFSQRGAVRDDALGSRHEAAHTHGGCGRSGARYGGGIKPNMGLAVVVLG
jgi:hypothetical protein